jgi:hypothetical protein
MKKIIFFIWIGFFSCFGQKELWTLDNGNLNGYIGSIVKFDINGENPVNMHEFSLPNGNTPPGKLFLASNGKLYGTATGGIIGPLGSAGNAGWGVLFEYDLILNKYRVVHFFNDTEGVVDYFNGGVIEPVVGKLYGCTQNRVFKYDLNLETLTFCSGNTGLGLIGGELMQASNGNIYGIIKDRNPCPNFNSTGYYYGGIFKVNLLANSVAAIYDFKCDFLDGARPKGALVEATPGKLYGVAESGGYVTPGVGISPNGTLFEYNYITNVFTKKIAFDGDNLGSRPQYLINVGNGKLYGVCQEGGTAVNEQGETRHDGTLFEYVPATNSITVLQNYIGTLGVFTGNYPVSAPKSLLKTSNNTYVGTDRLNPFIYDAILNTSTYTSSVYQFNYGKYATVPFIEICRKPSYQEFLVNTFTPAVGTAFTYDIVNTNATTYVWKKGTIILPAQTTGVLNLPSVTTNDTGVYTCTMTNECGTTITANLNINVVNLAVETVDDYKTLIFLYPNPTKGIINLKFPENRGLKGIKYKITNLLGQVIIENDISTSNKNELAINTSSFANGVYQLTLVTDKGNWNGKFVKE